MPEPTSTPTSPTAPSAPAPASTPTPGLSDSPFYADIDALAKGPEPKPAPAKEGEKSPPSDKPAGAAPTSKPATSAEAGKDSVKSDSPDGSSSAKGAEKPGDKPATPPPVKAAELRAAYEELKRKHAALTAEHEKVKTAKPAEDPEKKTLLENLDTLRKRTAELEEKLKFTNFQETDEYKAKYHKPFLDAYARGRSRASHLTVTEADGTERPGTAADFDAIMRAPESQVAKMASEMFGLAAPLILSERMRIEEINDAAATAQEEFRKTAEERNKQEVEKTARQKAETEKQRAEMSATFARLNTEAVEARPQFFKADEGDEKGAGILKTETALADLAFGALPPERYDELPEGIRAKLANGMLPPAEIVRLHSAMRTKAAGFGHVVHKLAKATERIKQLEIELSEFKASEPTGGMERRGGEAREKTVDEEIDALAR